MTNRLYIDIETFSPVPIDAGVYRYASHPSFRILMAAWAVEDEPVQIAIGEDEIKAIPGLWEPGTKVAHNAQFERVCFSALRGSEEFLDPSEWHDTMAIAAESGLPQGLGNLAKRLGVAPKDEAGTRLINLFCVPRKIGSEFRAYRPDEKPDDWLDFIFYCMQDVETLREVDRALGGWPTPVEREVWIVDQRINDRGIDVDVELARRAVTAAEENRASQSAEITEMTGVANPGSRDQMMSWLRASGLDMPDLQAATVEAALSGALTDEQRRVLQLRQELALVASKKFQAALDGVSGDGLLRGQFRFYGAHTGRWTGRGVQLQNLPRASLKTDAEADAAIVDLKMGLGADAATLKKLVRPMFLGPMVVVDYAAIEARVVAWLAGEEWALQAFRDGRDIYVETAERMGGLTRAQGKIAVLALGYNGGIGSLKAMGGASTYYDPRTGRAINSGTLAESAKDGMPQRLMNDEELGGLVRQWRRANRQIVSLWAKLDESFYRGGPAGRLLRVDGTGKDRQLVLPSGRSIHYRQTSFRMDAQGRRRATFLDVRGYRVDTYGGRLTENATQAVARDVLAEALVRLEARGYETVAHVHDEILVRGTDLAGVQEVMNEPPAWAEGLPIGGSGFVCDRYRKG